MNDTPEPTRRILLSDSPTLRERVASMWQGLGDAWDAASARVFVWRKTGNVSAAKALAVILAAIVAQAIYIDAMGFLRPAKPAPVAAQTNPLAPLIARIDALEAAAAPIAAPEATAQAQAPARARRPVQSPAAPAAAAAPGAPAAEAAEAPAAPRWGTTDLDRAIALHKRVTPDLFPTTTGAPK